jgi:hypothetical protein
MLKDIDRSKLQQAKDYALELVQDIEQMQAMLDDEDTHENVIIFNQQIMHPATMNALYCTGIFQDLDRQAYKGTHLESKRTPEETAKLVETYKIEEAIKLLQEKGLIGQGITIAQ